MGNTPLVKKTRTIKEYLSILGIPFAGLPQRLVPAVHKVVCMDLKASTHFNAVKTALNLYIIKAKTGGLPDSLPDGMPKDLFSGKDFKYEKTKEGFVLGCRGKDLAKNKIYKYEFKVKK